MIVPTARPLDRSGPLTLDHPDTGPDTAATAALMRSLSAAGIDVTARPVDADVYAEHITNPDTAGDLVTLDWAPPVANGVAALTPLLSYDGTLSISRL